MSRTMHYYEDEMRYLYESGRRFAAAHPDRARFLNVDAVGDRDPTVERLFEGFAFLTARIREKIDELFPEMTETLIERLWPQLLRDIPSAAVVELKPRRGLLQQTRTLPRGLEVLSSQVGPEKVRCRFVTTSPVRLNPITLTRADTAVDTRGRQSLSLTFQLDNGINREAVSLDPVRLYLHAEFASALALHEYLTSHVVAARLTDADGRVLGEIPPDRATAPGGLTPEESLLPHQATGAWGYSLLAEYFAYPEKFLFVDLHGLDAAGRDTTAPSSFTLTLTFDRPFPKGVIPTAETFRLFCTPVINLYQRDAEPIRTDGRRESHCVIADSACPKTIVTHSVVSVTGVDRGSGRRTAYIPASAAAFSPGDR
ncbi:MAG: type VI secretion system baseplate subunit TssF, partial [Chitinivibrionales bacterium]|nr:type VI secretion system baseplate subunit TssF [Chitinivibrionales bacterium]